MSTSTATPAPVKGSRGPRPQPARFVNLVLRPNDRGENGVVRITVKAGRKLTVTDYLLSLVPSAFGRGFLLVKLLGEHDGYHVNLDGPRSSCECKGFLAHGKPCKHVGGLQKLVETGRL
jgi:hypothetical protein